MAVRKSPFSTISYEVTAVFCSTKVNNNQFQLRIATYNISEFSEYLCNGPSYRADYDIVNFIDGVKLTSRQYFISASQEVTCGQLGVL